MKKSKALLTLLISTFSAIGLIFATSTTASASYSFDVISDTHIGASEGGSWHPSNLKTTFDAIKNSHYSNYQCIVINGDVVDNSQQSTYDQLYNVIYNNRTNLPYIYFNIGNHEYDLNPYVQPNIIDDRQTALNRFNNNTNHIRSILDTKGIVTDTARNNTYDVQYINGKNDRLVFLGTDEIPSNPSSAYLDPNTQLNWLINSAIYDNTVQGKDTPNGKKPMFIFLHQPLYNTTYGSTIDDWGYLYPNNSTIIKNALNGHPEIVVFTGHTHEQFTGSSDPWNNNNYYSLGDSSAKIFNVPSIGEDKGNGPEGYHVTVYSDGIVVTGVKYTSAGCIKMNTRTIDF